MSYCFAGPEEGLDSYSHEFSKQEELLHLAFHRFRVGFTGLGPRLIPSTLCGGPERHLSASGPSFSLIVGEFPITRGPKRHTKP